jgi:hypothetical protein
LHHKKTRNGSVRFGHNNHVARKWKLGPVQGTGDLCGGRCENYRQSVPRTSYFPRTAKASPSIYATVYRSLPLPNTQWRPLNVTGCCGQVAYENGPRLWWARAGSMGRHGAGLGLAIWRPRAAVPSAATDCAPAVSHQLGNRAAFALITRYYHRGSRQRWLTPIWRKIPGVAYQSRC